MWANLPDCYDFDASETQWSRLESYDSQQFETKLRGFVGYKLRGFVGYITYPGREVQPRSKYKQIQGSCSIGF